VRHVAFQIAAQLQLNLNSRTIDRSFFVGEMILPWAWPRPARHALSSCRRSFAARDDCKILNSGRRDAGVAVVLALSSGFWQPAKIKQFGISQSGRAKPWSYDIWKAEFRHVRCAGGLGIAYQNPNNGFLSNHWITLHETGNVAGFIPVLVMDVGSMLISLTTNPLIVRNTSSVL